MVKKILILIVATLLISSGLAHAVDLPRTGQTKCYDVGGGEIDPCTGTGQDGEIQAGVIWPSPRFETVSDEAVKDLLTGLIWMRHLNTPSVGNIAGGNKTWEEALKYVNDLNEANYGGRNDWHLPNANELLSLFNAGHNEEMCGNVPCPTTTDWLKKNGFVDSSYGIYWTSTTRSDLIDKALSFHIYSYTLGVLDKTLNQPLVLAVASQSTGPTEIWKTGQTTSYSNRDDGALKNGVAWPDPRFKDNNDGTITDNLTNLIWLKDPNCVKTINYNFGGQTGWEEAYEFIKGINNGTYSGCAAGHNDWRLPNLAEFHSLVDYSKIGPALPEGNPFVTENIGGFYWTSDTLMTYKEKVGVMSPHDGNFASAEKSTNKAYVWPVRGGIVGEPNIALSSMSVDFDKGTLGTQYQQTLTVTNDGKNYLYLGELAKASPVEDPFSIIKDDCSNNYLKPGESCEVTIGFTPTAEESYSGEFDIPSSDKDEPTITVALSGVGTTEIISAGEEKPQVVEEAAPAAKAGCSLVR